MVNNLIDLYGKPDLIRVEVARDVGNSKRQREEKAAGIRRQERRRKVAREALQERGIAEPSRTDIEKWMLWEECGKRCPYTGDTISFEALFHTGEFQVEHIWPRFRSLDNSFRNKTLCRTDVNRQKGNQTPYELFRSNEEEWDALANRLASMKGGKGMSPGKIRRFLAPSIPEDFAARQLNDTGYAAREAVAYLKKLWPDQGPKATVKVFAVSGRVTGHLRRLWHLNNILAEDGAKTRADHRHHAIDALTVACCYPGMTQKLSRHWQEEDDPRAPQPHLPSPWETIRSDAERAAAAIVVSHRVRRKVSGQLHKETIYRDTGEEIADGRGTTYRVFVRRKPVEKLTNSESERFNGSRIIDIVDDGVRDIVQAWVDKHGGDPGAAFVDGYPKRGRKGPEIRKVRLRVKQQLELMTKASTGYATRATITTSRSTGWPMAATTTTWSACWRPRGARRGTNPSSRRSAATARGSLCRCLLAMSLNSRKAKRLGYGSCMGSTLPAVRLLRESTTRVRHPRQRPADCEWMASGKLSSLASAVS